MNAYALRGYLRPGCTWFCVLLITIALAGCGSGYATISTAVEPLAAENIRSACTYDLLLSPGGTLQVSTTPVQGVLVLYARGDTDGLYQDTVLRAAAQELHLAIVWAHECNARTYDDMQPDAAQGPARMLFAALTNFAQVTHHTELATTGLILYGFSAAGVVTATLENAYSDRVLGAVLYAAGSGHLDLDQIAVTAAAVTIPTLILANAEDSSSGTSRSYRYFERGRAQGAPWAYGVQNGTGHCCALSTRGVLIPWMQAVAGAGASAKVQAGVVRPRSTGGTPTRFVCTPDRTVDGYGENNCSITAASVGAPTASVAAQESGWMPTDAAGAAWLAWVTNAGTN